MRRLWSRAIHDTGAGQFRARYDMRGPKGLYLLVFGGRSTLPKSGYRPINQHGRDRWGEEREEYRDWGGERVCSPPEKGQLDLYGQLANFSERQQNRPGRVPIQLMDKRREEKKNNGSQRRRRGKGRKRKGQLWRRFILSRKSQLHLR